MSKFAKGEANQTLIAVILIVVIVIAIVSIFFTMRGGSSDSEPVPQSEPAQLMGGPENTSPNTTTMPPASPAPAPPSGR